MAALRSRPARHASAPVRTSVAAVLETLEHRRLLCASHGVGRGGADLGDFPAIPAGVVAGPQPAGGTTTTTTTVAASVPLTDVPALNSVPTATKRVFLDFNGAPATTWGSYSVPATPAYSTDTDKSTFSDADLVGIRDVWARVSEKFAPFNINVTTVDPGTYTSGQTLRVVIGGSSTWLGSGAGGVAYVNSFTSVSSAKNTVWIFPDNLANGNPKYVAEASAHESGHGFGLQHQSTYDATGTKTAEYNPGTSAKAPIMGNSYSAARGLWWYGTSATSSTSVQDDVAVISRGTNGFGYRPDEAGDTPATAAALAVSGSAASAAGVITTTADVDYYAFSTGAGTVAFSGSVVASGATLDLKLSLYAADGSLVASADSTALGESLSATVPAGTYRLAVASHGTYGDIGQYSVGGTVVAVDSVAAPTSLAAAASGTSVSLTWADNSTNETGFAVQRSTDPAFGAAATTTVALPANTTAYADAGLADGSTYYYRVAATGAVLSSLYSNVASATTAPVAPASTTATATSSSQVTVAWSDVAGETAYSVERSADGGTTWAVAGTTAANVVSLAVNNLAPNTTYAFRVRASNAAGGAYGPVATATTPNLPAAPADPTSLTIGTVARGRVPLAWLDNATTETGYYVERSTNGGSWVRIATLGANAAAYTDTSVARRKTYSYRVQAFNAGGVSAYSNVATATTPSPAVASVLGGKKNDNDGWNDLLDA